MEKTLVENRKFYKFLSSEILISYGLFNGIINALIFYFTEPKGTVLSAQEMSINIGITMMLLSIILSLCIFPLTKMKYCKGQIPPNSYHKAEHYILRAYPTNRFLQIIVTMILSAIFTTFLVSGWSALLGISHYTVLQGAVYKGVACWICGTVTAYFTVINSILQLSNEE